MKIRGVTGEFENQYNNVLGGLGIFRDAALRCVRNVYGASTGRMLVDKDWDVSS